MINWTNYKINKKIVVDNLLRLFSFHNYNFIHQKILSNKQLLANLRIKFLYMHCYKIIIIMKMKLQKPKFVTHPIIFT